MWQRKKLFILGANETVGLKLKLKFCKFDLFINNKESSEETQINFGSLENFGRRREWVPQNMTTKCQRVCSEMYTCEHFKCGGHRSIW